jgi:hypothetical protein
MTGPLDELDSTDRILLGACVAAWLAALGAGVAAIVALVDLGRGQSQGSGSAGTPWLLYTVIGISAVVIVGAVPLLLRARAQAGNRQQPQSARGPVRPPAQSTPGRRVVIPGRTSEPPFLVSRYGGDDAAAAAVEQVWLRCTLGITAAIGAATAAICIATYLMATESDLGAWICYGVAGLITVAMVALPIVALRQLDELTAA